MATEVITRTLCDVHLATTVDESDIPEADAFTLTVSGKTVVIDLCKKCRVERLEPFLDFLAEYGRGPDAKGTRAKPLERQITGATENCPACDYSGTKAQVRAHARQKHNATLIDLRGETTEFVCPHCNQHFEGNQGLAVHITRSHGGEWEPTPEQPKAPARRGK